MSLEPDSQIGGKWSAGDSVEEQAETVRILQDHLEFDNNYQYSEEDKENSRFNQAVVRGFWLEESSAGGYDWDFVANMELMKDNAQNELVPIRFAYNEDDGGFIDRKLRVEEFFKLFGVDDRSLSKIIGRKCLYKDHRDEDASDLDEGLTLFNSRKTQWTMDSQWVAAGLMLGGVGSLLFFENVSPNLAALGIILALIGTIIGFAGPLRDRFDSNAILTVKNYMMMD